MPIKVTNKYDAPEELYKAATVNDHVTKGDISVTTLINSPRIRKLKEMYEVEEDVADYIFMMIGTAFHSTMENSTYTYRDNDLLRRAYKALKRMGKDELADGIVGVVKEDFKDEIVGKEVFPERTLTLTVNGTDKDGDDYTYKVSGTQDYYNKRLELLRDYKVCGVNKYTKEDYLDWEKQQNIYAHMLRAIGCNVKKIEILAFFRDWSKMSYITKRKKIDSVYPNAPFKRIQLRLWSPQECEDYIKERVAVHQYADKTGTVPECTAEERWAQPDCYAVMSDNRKNAVRKFVTKEDAIKFIRSKKIKLVNPRIEYRIDVGFKCNFYCSLNSVCDQYKKRLEYHKQTKSKK